MVTQYYDVKGIREAQRLAAAALLARDVQQWEKAKQLFIKATGRTLH